jgi:hypothetical protein
MVVVGFESGVGGCTKVFWSMKAGKMQKRGTKVTGRVIMADWEVVDFVLRFLFQ